MSDINQVNKLNMFVDSGKGFTASRRYSRAETYPMHRHEYFEIEIILSGSGTQNLNGETYELKRGTFYFLTNTDFHELHIAEPLLNYNISFNMLSAPPEFMEKTLYISQRVFTPPPNEFHRLCLLADLLENACSDRLVESEYTHMLLLCLLGRIGTILENSSKNSPPALSATVQQIILYLHANFRNDPSTDEIAEYAQLSKNYMSNLFKKETGIPLVKYISNLKISYAKKLLTVTNMPIGEICFESGYGSIPNFMKSFKLNTGYAPMQYRKNFKEI